MQTALTYRTNRDLFSNYYLDEYLPETEEWYEVSDEELQQAYDDIMDLWEREKDTAPKRNESQLEEKFIRPMFRKLGIPFEVEESTDRTQRRPDYGFFETDEAARDAFERRDEGGDFYKNSIAVADAKRWGRPLDTRGSGEHERDFENPSYQIHVYLQEVDAAQWAVLTDGKKWRLYYGPTSHRLDSYYEVDLATILEKGDLEDFKYFYLFFRHEAFLEDTSGDCFLDDVYGESNVFAQELGEDLQDNIYQAIKILSEGFLQYPDNDLDEGDLDLIHDSSLIYLYRLIFILYAEAEGRDLLDTDNEIYEQSYSLNSLKQEVAEEIDSGNPKYRDWQDNLWNRLDELFKLIDQGSKSRGIPEEDLYIPAYNGGLFRTDPDEDDNSEAQFLAEHTAGDAYLAKVIELLTRSENSNGGGKIFVDYSSLDVRHLGSIYEGLLEYQLNIGEEPLALDDGEYVSADEGDDIVVQEGEVYLTTDSGERKATGSYYTPEYVVEYIVENSLGPLVEDIRIDLAGQSAFDEGGFAAEFAERVFNLKILDPAMGSGHFLTSAVDYLAREIIDAQEKQAAQQGIETVDEEHDINWARRQVAQRCIYGVDLNPLAVELAKVSLWLRTLAAEQPLAFLDHHLKTGNSLVGSNIETVLDNGDSQDVEGQLTLQESFDRTRRQALEHVTDQFEDLLAIDNETLDDIKEMEAVYEETRDDPLYQHLIAMANVHTAEYFGLDIPSDAYERMATALRDDSWSEVEQQVWYQSAQQIADDEYFFHWEMEFPIVFYEQDGERKDNGGFDVVIGNPPWLNAWRMTDQMPKKRDAIKQVFESSDLLEGHWDLYIPFIIQSLNLCRNGGRHSFILPNLVLTEKYAKDLRRSLLSDHTLESILDFGERNVFEEVERQSIVYVVEGSGDSTVPHKLQSCTGTDPFNYKNVTNVHPEVWLDAYNCQIRLDEDYVEKFVPIINKMENNSKFLGQYLYVNVGATVASSESGGFVKNDVVCEEPVGNAKKFIQGTNVGRWYFDWDGEWLDYRPDEMSGPRHSEMFEAEKLLVRKRTDKGEWIAAAYDDEGMYCDDTVLVCCDYDILKDTGATLDFEGFERLDKDLDLPYTVALLNSTLMTWLFKNKFETGGLQGTYSDVWPQSVRSFPIPETDGKDYPVNEWTNNALTVLPNQLANKIEKTETPEELVSVLSEYVIEAVKEQKELNLNILDYLSIPGDELPDSMTGDSLEDLQIPVAGVADTPITETTKNFDSLRVEGVSFEDDGRLLMTVDISYKPDEDDSRETDTWGRLVEEEFETYDAMAFVGLSKETETLIRNFVPAAVEKGDGFAGFRKEATKTNSPLDRLKDLTLPDIEIARNGLERYTEVKGHAEELDEMMEETGQLIDEIIYDLYDLTDEEVEIVESAV